ncbi:3-ketoacyl-CoA synthase 12 [Ancistrocladus abbreviatus]
MGKEESATLSDSISEMDEFFHDSIDKLLVRSGVSPQEIDILVVNVSMLSITPSLCSRIINHYKMREDVKVINLTGMGCSASLMSIDAAHNIFKSYNDAYALIVMSESLSPNCNNISVRHKAMFKLKCLVRTHHGARDESYGCCMQREDADGR